MPQRLSLVHARRTLQSPEKGLFALLLLLLLPLCTGQNGRDFGGSDIWLLGVRRILPLPGVGGAEHV